MSVKLSGFFVTLTFAWIVITAALYLLLGDSILLDASGVMASIAIGCVVILMLKFNSNQSLPTFSILAFLLIVHYFNRITFYQIFPGKINLPYYTVLSPEEVSNSLFYILAGLVFIIIGVNLGSVLHRKISVKHNQNANLINYSPYSLIFLYLFFVALDFTLIFIFDISYLRVEKLPMFHSLAMLIRTLINVDAAFLFICFLLMQNINVEKLNLKLLSFFVLSYWLITILYGSRGGVLRITMVFLCIWLAKYAAEKIKLKTLMLIVVIILISAPLTFMLGNVVRVLHTFNSLDNVDQLYSIENTIELSTEDTRNSIYQSDFFKNYLEPHLPKVLIINNRLGVIDFTLIALNRIKNDMQSSFYMSFEYLYKSITNILLPGLVYPEAEMRTNRLLSVVVGYETNQMVKSRLISNPYTAWGAAYIYFGYIGGLFFLLFVSTFIQFILSHLQSKNNSYSYIFLAAFLWILFGGFIINFGLDQFLTDVIFIFLQLLFVIAIFWFFQTLVGKRKEV